MIDITQKLINNNYTPTRSGYSIRLIVIHTYGGGGSSLYNWFNRVTTKASSHYAVLKSGVIEQYVLDRDVAWHAGTGQIIVEGKVVANLNLVSIGIEHQDDNNPNDAVRTPELYESSARLVAKLCIEHHIPCDTEHIRKHRDYNTGKTCPGNLDVNRIIQRANEIMRATPDHSNEFVVVQSGWGLSNVALAAGYQDYGTKAAWNRIAQLNGVSDYTKMRLYAGQRVRVLAPIATVNTPVNMVQEDGIMIEDLKNQIAEKDRILLAKEQNIQDLNTELNLVKQELVDYRKSSSDSFFQYKTETDGQINALKAQNEDLSNKLKTLTDEDLTDKTYISKYQELDQKYNNLLKELEEYRTAPQIPAIFTPSVETEPLQKVIETKIPVETAVGIVNKVTDTWNSDKVQKVFHHPKLISIGTTIGLILWLANVALEQILQIGVPREWNQYSIAVFIFSAIGAVYRVHSLYKAKMALNQQLEPSTISLEDMK